MKTFKQLAYIGAILAASIASSQAQVITVPNFSFETPEVADGDVAAPSNWTFSSSGGGTYNSVDSNYGFTSIGSPGNPLGTLPSTAEGVNYAFIQPGSNFMYQTLSAVYLADTTYTFTLALGNSFGTSTTNNVFFGLYSAANDPVTSPLGTLTMVDAGDDGPIPQGTFADFTFTYTTPSSGGPIGTAIQLGVISGEQQANVDNLRLSSVPEPSTYAYAMVLFGFAALRFVRRRRVID